MLTRSSGVSLWRERVILVAPEAPAPMKLAAWPASPRADTPGYRVGDCIVTLTQVSDFMTMTANVTGPRQRGMPHRG